jgi:hypothetical protein
LASNIDRKESISSPALVMMKGQGFENARTKIKSKNSQRPCGNERRSGSRGELESTIEEAVRSSSPACAALVGVIVERVVPQTPGGVTWVVKGVKYGKAERVRCAASLLKCVEEGQREYDVLD